MALIDKNKHKNIISSIIIFTILFTLITCTISRADFFDKAWSDDATDDNTSKITKLSATVQSGAKGVENNDANDWVWKATTTEQNHAFVIRVSYEISGDKTLTPSTMTDDDELSDYKTAGFQLRVPKTILLDRNGNQADKYSVSVPSASEYKEISAYNKSRTDYIYTVDDDDIVIFNVHEITSAESGYFDISYSTTEKSYDYLDYDGKDDQSYPDGSSDFSATLSVNNTKQETEAFKVYIDTSATIASTYKYKPDFYDTWQSSWGTKPSDADDYYYLKWCVRTKINDIPTQRYTITLDDTPSSSTGDVEIVGYDMNGNGRFTLSNTSQVRTTQYDSYDYVLTRHKKSTFDEDSSGEKISGYSIKNIVKTIVHPYDGVDIDSSASSTRTFTWTRPSFGVPVGHFGMWKYGNENAYLKKFNFGDYESYALDSIRDGKADSLNDIRYVVETDGLNSPWTTSGTAASDSEDDVAATYGKRSVKYVVEDSDIYLVRGDDNTFSHEEWEKNNQDEISKTLKLGDGDYQIDNITIDFTATDFNRDSNGTVTLTSESSIEGKKRSFTDIDTFDLEVKKNGEWTSIGTFKLGGDTSSNSDLNGDIVKTSSISDGNGRISFNDGVTGYRISSVFCDYEDNITVSSSTSLKASDTVVSFLKNNTDDDDDNTVMLKNKAKTTVYQEDTTDNSEWNEILSVEKVIGDRLRATTRNSEIHKDLINQSNDTVSREYKADWRVIEKETYEDDRGLGYVPQNGGTFYDLLPSGATLDIDSVKLYSGESKKGNIIDTAEISTIDNYNNSGRTMLIASTDETADWYSLVYTTIHSWDSLSDWGTDITNPVAYETGNDDITNGYADNGGMLSDTNKTLFTGLDSDSSGKARFIYAETTTEAGAVTSALSGLTKTVIGENNTAYTYSSKVSSNGTYKYNIRYANSYSNETKNILIFEPLERLVSSGDESQWHGKLTGIDVSQAIAAGAHPVIYLTDDEDISIEQGHFAINNNPGVSKYKEMSVYKEEHDGSLADVTAILIDLSISENQTADHSHQFVLGKGKSISITLFMQAPDKIDSNLGTSAYANAYNSIYMQGTSVNQFGTETGFDINQGHTTVSYRPTADIKLTKINADNHNEKIKGIQFRLNGASDYGTEVDEIEITNSNGETTFDDIEPGEYTLQEYGDDDDWIEDHTSHTVKIDSNGKVSFDGTDVDELDNGIQIENSPRIHTDISFSKVDAQHHSVKITGAKFRLTGTSDYGTDVIEYGESDDNGTVSFSNIEKGKYELIETSAPDGYSVSKTKYKVNVDSNSLYTIEDDEGNDVDKTSTGYIIGNEPLHSVSFIKRSTYDKSVLSGAEFSLSGSSDNGTAVDATQTSDDNGIVRFDGLESGNYALTETKAPDGYAVDSTPRIVSVKQNGDYTISGLIEEGDGDARYLSFYDKRNRDKTITIVKQWDDGLTDDPSSKRNNDPTSLAMTLQTTVPEASVRSYAIEFDANGGEFDDGNNTNTVTFDALNRQTNGSYAVPANGGITLLGWSTSKDSSVADFNIDQVSNNSSMNSIKNGETVKLYAVWKDMHIDYAVSIYGIGEDIDENGNTMGLTFGPSLGMMFTSYRNDSVDPIACYIPCVRAHKVSDSTYEIDDNDVDDNKQTTVTETQAQADLDARQNENEPAITDSTVGGRNVILGDDAGTTEDGNAYRCVHYDNWNTIIYWNKKDPHVYDKCIDKRCSKTVRITPTPESVSENAKAVEIDVDGVYSDDNIFTGRKNSWTIPPYATGTGNDNRSEDYSVFNVGDGTPFINNSKWNLSNYENLETSGKGYSGSLIRARLNGADSLTNYGAEYAGADAVKYNAEKCSYIAAFPENLRNAIGRKDLVASSNEQDTEVNSESAKDKLWLFTLHDFIGSKAYTGAHLNDEKTELYYTDRASLVWFWLRTVGATELGECAHAINGNGGEFYQPPADAWGGVAPGFSLTR